MSKRMRIVLCILLSVVFASCAPGAAPTPVPAPPTAVPAAVPTAEQEPTVAPTAAEKVTLTLWAYEGYQDYLPVLIEAFEAKYPNIHVELTNIPEEQYGVKVETAVAAGTPPDLGFTGDRRWFKQGLFLPLDDSIAKAGIDLSTWNAGIIGQGDLQNAEEACRYDGKTYCLGSYTGAVMLFYNKDMFDAAGIAYPKPWPPMTIEEYVDLAARLTNKDKEVWGTANGDPVTWLPWEVVVSPDGRKAEGVVNGAISVRVHEQIAGLFQKGYAPSLNVMDPWQQGVDFFSQGKLAMVITDFQSLFKIEKAGINYGVTHPPTPQGVQPFFNVWTDSIGVFAKAPHPEEAKLFVMFQATEGQRLRVEKTGDVPVSVKMAQDLGWADDKPGRAEALEVLAHARPNVYLPNRWEVAGPLFDAFGYIVSGEKSAQAALDEAAPLMQENLDKEWADWEK